MGNIIITKRFFIFISFFIMLLTSCGSKKRVGAICHDGWRSYATGSGACSHHGGVDYWLYEGDEE